VILALSRNKKLYACVVMCLFWMLALSPVLAPARTTTSQRVKFTLKADDADSSAINVKVSFTMRNGMKAVFRPSEQNKQRMVNWPVPTFALQSQSNSAFTVEPAGESDEGWIVTSALDGVVQFAYKVKFANPGGAYGVITGEAPLTAGAPRAIASMDLKAFVASDALMAPENEYGEYLSNQFSVKVLTTEGQTALAPWKIGDDGDFEVGSTSELFSNILAWGKIKKIKLRSSAPVITVGFAGDCNRLSGSQRASYGDALTKIYNELRNVMGARPRQSTVTALVVGAERYGLKEPASGSQRDSFVLFHGGKLLAGPAAAAAARAWFELWNRWSLVPSRGGDAMWMQEGLPWFFGYRTAARLGLMDASSAYRGFCKIYSDYLADPKAATVSLADAESNSESHRLLETKGAVLTAAMSVKLSNGAAGGAKDMEWLLGRMARKFNHFEKKEYSLVDVSEILEKGASPSWDRFFACRARGTDTILASEFSTTDTFGSGCVAGGSKRLSGKSSTKNWAYLVVAILIVFAIPLIFSAYIRRSIKLDMTMPNIFSDFDDEDS